MPKTINQDTENVALNRLKLHPRNANRGDVDAISESIEANGFFGTLVANKRTGNILIGNHRFQVAQAQGFDRIPVTWVDVDDETELRILLADNRTARLGKDDETQLAELLSELSNSDAGLTGTGFKDADLEQLLNDLASTGEASGNTELLTDPDEIPDNAPTRCKAGDLWQLGRHRLLCGDSTNRENVNRLLGGAVPNLMVTDPPYGVEYDANWRNNAERADGTAFGASAIGKVSNDDVADWTEAWRLFPGNVAYCWHAHRRASIVQLSLETCGFEIRSQIIWAKSNFAISRGHYHWKHEPCWYAFRKGEIASWIGDHSQTTLWEIDKPMKSETGHSTQKPVECMLRPMRNHDGDVYDPFLGSGTTLIAAEQTGRICYGMELEPKYCDVILARWEATTGQTAELLERADDVSS